VSFSSVLIFVALCHRAMRSIRELSSYLKVVRSGSDSFCQCPEAGGIFTKCNLVRALRGFQPITARLTFLMITEARLTTSCYDGFLQSSGFLKNVFSLVTVEASL